MIGHSLSRVQDLPADRPTSESQGFEISTLRVPYDEPDDEKVALYPRRLPAMCRLSHILITLEDDGAVSSSDTITWWITADSAGRIPITREVTSTFIPSLDGNRGGVSESMDVIYKALPSHRSLYVWAYSTISEVTAKAYVFWEAADGCECGCGGSCGCS